MRALKVGPEIHIFETFKEFCEEFAVSERDVILTSKKRYEKYLRPCNVKATLIFREDYSDHEPSDDAVDAMVSDLSGVHFDRVLAFGGGSVIDIAKLLALKPAGKTADMFLGRVSPTREKELIIIPTTCGTGSEVTAISVVAVTSQGTKLGLQQDALYGDYAVIIPEVIEALPYRPFIMSSIDALIHAVESFLSPKATGFTELFSLEAVRLIMGGYKEMLERGHEVRNERALEYMLAATYAGIAFGNAGTGAVHACAMTLGGAFDVPHGEANYQFFTEVFGAYAIKFPEGKIQRLNEIFSDLLGEAAGGIGSHGGTYDSLDVFLSKLIEKKPLRGYGMPESDIDRLADQVMANQQRLLTNSYVALGREDIRAFFEKLY